MSLAENVIVAHEEHGEVLGTWADYGFKGETLVYFDQHLDLKYIEESRILQISEALQRGDSIRGLNRELPFQDYESAPYGLDNFLYASFKLGMWAKVVWVYPEPCSISSEQLAKILLSNLSLLTRHGQEIIDSFEVDTHSTRVRVCGVVLEITTLSRLAKLTIDKNAWVDFDLDYFGNEKSELFHQPEQVMSVLSSMGLPQHCPTITYSISSGFLNEKLRWLGQDISTRLGADLVNVSKRKNTAKYSIDVVATKEQISLDRFHQLFFQELEALGGAGYSMASVLALNTQDRELSAEMYRRAVDKGDGAYWPAYANAIYDLEKKNYLSALEWIALAKGRLVDNLQNHAFCLQALCLAKHGRLDEALETAAACIQVLPLRKEPYMIATSLAKALGNMEKEKLYTESLTNLRMATI